eukprot:CAMPEP_0201513188 /NCGR_PEP_ID=MMETSP0161_2-20130828/5303_1 /ASSEMBLY_ACC=CAM_ASM_000251 /TAXON_ID=180227 /ORGANISM="Neoparamoeba aestuarina, Strain SoJaBio B1-5/56/2" /LENGTH=168 /DNA_ID=CAMNT_0047909313 /DNA_START=120 /DNA_END=626 /DNA_ORIENTATION=+
MEETRKLVEEIGVVVRIGDGLTLLHIAAQSNRIDVADYLLEKEHPLEMKTKVGETPLDQACWVGSVDVALALLKAGADPNCQTQMGYSPLHRCAFYDHPELAYHLLKHCANPDLKDFTEKQTPYEVAVTKGNRQMEEILKPGTTLPQIEEILKKYEAIKRAAIRGEEE